MSKRGRTRVKDRKAVPRVGGESRRPAVEDQESEQGGLAGPDALLAAYQYGVRSGEEFFILMLIRDLTDRLHRVQGAGQTTIAPAAGDPARNS